MYFTLMPFFITYSRHGSINSVNLLPFFAICLYHVGKLRKDFFLLRLFKPSILLCEYRPHLLIEVDKILYGSLLLLTCLHEKTVETTDYKKIMWYINSRVFKGLDFKNEISFPFGIPSDPNKGVAGVNRGEPGGLRPTHHKR